MGMVVDMLVTITLPSYLMFLLLVTYHGVVAY